MSNRAGWASIGWGGALLAAVLLVTGCSPHTKKTATTAATASASAAPTPLTAQELRWLEASRALVPKMNKVVTDSPTELTPAAMASFAKQLRGCGRELGRIGVPSARLLPVHALVERACGAYDGAAKCLDEAADMGIPFEGAASRKQEQKIRCGFGGAAKGLTLLVDADRRALQIKSAAS
ncbi:hypothetical protein ACRYCC_31600 [Actinomadura scrupuli]|uniref:hypothetical protein n=1 Tax=Actinomadura scrupuli TaxID=559629 RepID=UPI003D964AA1